MRRFFNCTSFVWAVAMVVAICGCGEEGLYAPDIDLGASSSDKNGGGQHVSVIAIDLDQVDFSGIILSPFEHLPDETILILLICRGNDDNYFARDLMTMEEYMQRSHDKGEDDYIIEEISWGRLKEKFRNP